MAGSGVNLQLLRLRRKRMAISQEQRKLETRRKIALGGLAVKAGLESVDPATLLGAMLEIARRLEVPEERERLREVGRAAFEADKAVPRG